MMKKHPRLLALVASAILVSGYPSGCFASDTAGVYRGPLTDYCNKVKKKVQTLAPQFTWDKDAVGVEVAVNSTGKIVETKAGSTANQKLAEQLIKGLDTLEPPPPDSKRPFWMSVWTSKKSDEISVSARDIDFGPYMSDLQKHIKRAWFPPKGKESERVSVVFRVDASGNVSGLKFARATGLADVDKAAMTAVENAKPFPKLPDGSPESVDIQFTFDYNVFNKHGQKVGGDSSTASANSGSSPRSSGSGEPVKVSHHDKSSSSSSSSGNGDDSGSSVFIKQGMKALERKDYPMAIQFLESAYAMDSNNDALKKSLSIAYNGMGSSQLNSNPDGAMEYFHKAKKYWPENPVSIDSVEQAKKIFGGTEGGASSSSNKD